MKTAYYTTTVLRFCWEFLCISVNKVRVFTIVVGERGGQRLGGFILAILAHVLGLDESYAAVDCETDDHSQVGHRRAHCDDDGLHHTEVLIMVPACMHVPHVATCCWNKHHSSLTTPPNSAALSGQVVIHISAFVERICPYRKKCP